MSFAAPMFAWVAGAFALATIALHLLAWRRPPASPLPTARFAPERPIRMVSRAVRPADLLLMALRVFLVMLVGVALAGPSLTARRDGLGRVIVVDRSRSSNGSDVGAVARSSFRTGDAIVVFDSAAREIAAPSADSLTAAGTSTTRGSLSAALVAALRAAQRLERERDSVEIVVVSRVTLDEIDAATPGIRRAWNGPVRVIQSTGAPNDARRDATVAVRAPEGDAVIAAMGLVGARSGGASVRVVRDAPTGADSAWAREGRTLVVWPADSPSTWQRRASVDTAFAVTASAADMSMPGASPATVVAPFERAVVAPPGRVVARWSDGEPAVTDAALGTGCVRTVTIDVPAAGDLALTPAFRHLARQITEPCGMAFNAVAAPDSVVAAVLPRTIAAEGGVTRAGVAGSVPASRLSAWLLGLALVVTAAELLVRRGGSDATA